MAEETLEGRPTGWDSKCHDNKKDNDNCIINIFCGDDDPKHDGFEDDKCCEKKNHKCIVNIFCNDKQHDECEDSKWHDKKNDGACIVNIFCGDKQHDDWDDEKCRDKKSGNCIINIFCHDKKPDNNW